MPTVKKKLRNGEHADAKTRLGFAAKLAALPIPGEDGQVSRDFSEHTDAGHDSRVSQVRRVFLGYGVVAEIAAFFAKYIALPDEMLLVASAWTTAAWLSDVWDRFPHMAITSPEKRCGKTRFMQLIELVAPNPYSTSNISPPAIYRLIESQTPKPTLLLDEAQSISRRGSEASEVTREMLNAGIDRGTKTYRCGGKDRDEVLSFSIYSPKVFALIGDLDGVLADRCLPISMKRKTDADVVEQYRSRIVEPIGHELRAKVEAWTAANREKVAKVFDRLEPFSIANDRMAELLMPLQAVLEVADKKRLPILQEYAELLDAKDREAERMSPGVRLLTACKEIFARVKPTAKDGRFLKTPDLIVKLVERSEEPWARLSHGEQINAETLARLLRPYGIKPDRSKDQKHRGYFANDFQEAWDRYTLKNPV
ncbi:MAG: DUF3631 domain-containing protein [Gemmataceae bacterium]|nr:DUF3631 domain-containing protein [Gemmataceae bacterium]